MQFFSYTFPILLINATKTRHDRYIPVPALLKELLSGVEKVDGCSHVFNSGGKKIVDFKHSFKTACRNAGLKDLRIHDLRHVFASKMVMNDISARAVIKANGFYSGGNIALHNRRTPRPPDAQHDEAVQPSRAGYA